MDTLSFGLYAVYCNCNLLKITVYVLYYVDGVGGLRFDSKYEPENTIFSVLYTL